MNTQQYQSNQISMPVKHYGQRGGIIGLIAAGILAVVTVLMCDFSCNESPVYIGVFIAFPIFYVIGAFIGFFWKNRMVRIIMLTIFGFLIIWFLIVYISELSG